MNRLNDFQVILVTLISFGVYFVFKKLFFRDLFGVLVDLIDSRMLSFLFTHLIIGIQIFIGTIFLVGRERFFEALGLQSHVLKGLGLGLLVTLPMLIGYGSSFDFNLELTITQIFTGSVCAAFFEELFYRGFLFGMLYRYTRLGFVPSIILCALIFGSIHLYQSDDLWTMVGIFFTTFMGAGLFAWLYAEWEFNLWVPIALHFFMNLFWDLFGVSGDALGGVNANIFRIMTITLAITGTVVYKLKNDGLQVNKTTLWIKAKQF